MIKKTITYDDFNGDKQTEEHYFHMSKMELVDMELSKEGGLSTFLPAIVKSGDTRKILDIFRSIIAQSYGVRSDDGKRFNKDPKATEEFMNSLAFEAMFMELVSSETAAGEFVAGIIPKDLADSPEISNALTSLNSSKSEELPWANRAPSSKELQSMTKAQLLEVMKRKSSSQE